MNSLPDSFNITKKILLNFSDKEITWKQVEIAFIDNSGQSYSNPIQLIPQVQIIWRILQTKKSQHSRLLAKKKEGTTETRVESLSIFISFWFY